MTALDLKKQIKNLPAKSGIYLFLNSRNKALYIGKALNLRSRANSYSRTADPRLQKMIIESKQLDFIVTDSDIDALIL